MNETQEILILTFIALFLLLLMAAYVAYPLFKTSTKQDDGGLKPTPLLDLNFYSGDIIVLRSEILKNSTNPYNVVNATLNGTIGGLYMGISDTKECYKFKIVTPAGKKIKNGDSVYIESVCFPGYYVTLDPYILLTTTPTLLKLTSTKTPLLTHYEGSEFGIIDISQNGTVMGINTNKQLDTFKTSNINTKFWISKIVVD